MRLNTLLVVAFMHYVRKSVIVAEMVHSDCDFSVINKSIGAREPKPFSQHIFTVRSLFSVLPSTC